MGAAAAEAEAASREAAALGATRDHEERRVEVREGDGGEGGLRVEVGADAAAEGVRGDEAVPALALAEERETPGEDARPRPCSAPRRARERNRSRRARWAEFEGQRGTLSARVYPKADDDASGGAESLEDELGGTGSGEDGWLARAETESRRSYVGVALQKVRRQRLRKFALQRRRESGGEGSSQEG